MESIFNKPLDEEVKDLNGKITPEIVASSLDANDSWQFTVCGNVCVFVFSGTSQRSPYTVPSQYRPTNSAGRGIVCNGDANDFKRAYVNSLDGKISIINSTSNVLYYGEIVWIIK